MSTPKIKLYRLFPGYSSQNDNDIQSAANDQLLPVVLKNIMPTNAYTLVGVGEKKLQALIPVLNYPCYNDSAVCTKLDKGFYKLPNIGIDVQDNSFNYSLVANRTNVMPTFYVKDANNVQKKYTAGVDYVYVKDSSSYEQAKETSSQVKFVLYFENNQWYIKFLDTTVAVSDEIYVKDLYQMILIQKKITDLSLKSQSVYYLSKLTNQLADTNGVKHQVIPVVGQYISYHLRPTITFDVDVKQVLDDSEYQLYVQSIYSALPDDEKATVSKTDDNNNTVVDIDKLTATYHENFIKTVELTQQTKNFTIDQNFRLSQINNNYIQISFGSYTRTLPSGLFQNKLCTLKYYIVPKFSYLLQSEQLNLDNLMFMSQQQDIYNGSKDATKPNTLYLQYVKSGVMQNKDVQNYVIQENALQKTIQPKLKESIAYCRGIIPRGQNAFVTISGVTGNFRNVYNHLAHSKYIQQYYTNKNNLKFPDSQYLLDVDRGIYYFRKYDQQQNQYNKTVFDETFCQNNDYFFSTYYHRASVTKVFVSDFQSWVTEHLRNNPDVFYGKKDYPGDDYIDANENAIKVGEIPQFLQGGYSISFRNGSVTFASDTQDLDYLGGTEQTKTSTDQNTGKMTGGVARANFAYYNGLQNVIDQKLQWDKSYTGGGYKYRALTDKQYPDSIGRRWVKRQNALQFIGASFVTQKLNDSGQLTTYNLPDLQTVQLQQLSKYGFAKCLQHEGYKQTDVEKNPKIYLDYFITTNNFSYPFVFKISNFRRLIEDSDKLYVTNMNQKTIKQRHPNLLGKVVESQFDTKNALDKFQENKIIFETLQGEQLQHIDVKYHEEKQLILPILKVKIPVLTSQISENTSMIQITKNSQFEYSDFQLCAFNSENKLASVKKYEVSEIVEQTIDKTTKIFVDVPDEYKAMTLYLKYRMTTNLYRSYDQFKSQIQTTMVQQSYENSSSSDSSDSSYNSTNNVVYIGNNFNVQKRSNSQLVFSISNVHQTTYFKLSVIDFYSKENEYNSTIVYTIKKYDL